MKTAANHLARLLEKVTLILFMGVVSMNASYASHFVGGEIYYQWVSGNTYNITASLYRDCSGIPAPSSLPVSYESVSCASTGGTINLTLTSSAVQITPICAASLANSSCNGGLLYGVEQNIYEGTVTLPFNCSDWQFSYNTCCRNGAITNLDNSIGYGTFLSSLLNNLDVPFNNSIRFGSIPLNMINENITTQLSWNTYDVDGDSLIYELTPARDYSGSSPFALNYSPGLTYNQPFISSFPTTLDFATGVLEVTPNSLQVSVVCMKVSEYRNGFLIGEFAHEFGSQ